MVKVLVTGGLGGIGQHVVRNLVLEGCHEIVVFDLKNRMNETTARDTIFMNDNITIVWGDITKPETYPDLISFNVIIHMAFIIPPASETLPIQVTEKVNVQGTQSLIDSAVRSGFEGKFVFASSVTVFGPTMWHEPPVTRDHPVNPTDRYTAQKAICEKYLIESPLKWLILRVSAAMNIKQELSPENLKMLYAIPYDQRFEFVHPMDVALAFSNSVNCEAVNEILIIAGGERCRHKYHELIEGMLSVFNLPPPDKNKFTTKYYYLDYYDTLRSQKLLQYQTRTFNDFIEDYRMNVGPAGGLIRFFAPIAKYFI